MEIKKKRSALLFSEGFLIESRFWLGNPFAKGYFLGLDDTRKLRAIIPANGICSHESML
jgi:hypothetical protein